MAVNDSDISLNGTDANVGCNISSSACSRYGLCTNPIPRIGVYILLPANVVIGAATILCNSLVFAAYYKTPPLRTTSNMFILSLTAAYLLTSLISEPIFLTAIILFLNCSDGLLLISRVLIQVVLFLVGAALQNLSLISAERYIAIFYSLRYNELVTVTRCYKVIICSWAVWLLFEVLLEVSVLLQDAWKYGSIITVASNTLFIVVIYSQILREVRRIEQNAPHPAVSGLEAAQAQETAQEIKAAKTVGLIIGLLFLCYLPFLFYM